MANYLITGYWGEPHVTAENDRGINAAIFGAGRFVLPVGQQFRAEYIGNNTVRMYDGKLMDNGAAAGIPAGEYIDFLIPNTSQGMARFDIIAFQYSQDPSTLVEKGEFVVLKGEETIDPIAPTLTQEDLLTNKATFDQVALWRILVTPATISSVTPIFEVWGGGSAAKPQRITGTGDVTITFEDNTEYKLDSVRILTMTFPSNVEGKRDSISFHGFITFSTYTPIITITNTTNTPMYVMGDDINNAAPSETWEFSYHSAHMIWKNWG